LISQVAITRVTMSLAEFLAAFEFEQMKIIKTGRGDNAILLAPIVAFD